ncbi:MAG: DUF4019 domain-containing protein [Pseudomonadota bacterium]|nr:DUF4019 domain-containing protein [Pseudomonadota bacterium]
MPNLLYVAAASLLGLEQPQTSPPVQVERLGDAGYRLTVTADGTQNPAAAHALLRPTADGLCGDLPALYGRYRFEAHGPAQGQPGPARESVTLIQDLSCGGAPPAAAAEPVPIALAQADIDALTPVILDLTGQYFTAVEQSRDSDAFALTTPEMTGGASVEHWIARAGERRDFVGAPVSRQIARLTWYPNPPNSPRPGLYVAVDYVAGWSLQEECGYLIWFRPDTDSPFRLTRQEQTFLPHELDDATRSALRARHCILL